jgi:hypothetical protein
MQTDFTVTPVPDHLKSKYIVLVDLRWLPPGVRENNVELSGLAAEKVTKERPRQTGIYRLSDFAGKWRYSTVVPSLATISNSII